MSVQDDLSALADLNGILPSFHDLQGHEYFTSPETQKALLHANGIDVSTPEAISRSLADLRHQIEDRWFPEEVIVESGAESAQNYGLGADWYLTRDDSDQIIANGAPADCITLPPLPSGIYVLTATASGRTETVTVIAAPRHLPSIPALTGAFRLWGMNLALYGLRSDRNTGIGDFEDLASVSEIVARKGASFLGINPLHVMGHCDTEAISPYSPSHRGFLNTAYIALDCIPGLAKPKDAARLAPLNRAGTVDYEGHKPTHQALLEDMFERFTQTAKPEDLSAFASFKTQGGHELSEFATFEAHSEAHGPDWHRWPATLTPPAPERTEFHMWLQWVAGGQLASAQERAKSAGMALGLYLDLAVGSRRDGAESWCEQEVIADGVSIGAPPDHLSPAGQNWNLAAFAPRKLRAARYRPLRRILSQTLRHAGVIRIDHVLGLNRSFWIPDDGSPGAYIKQPFDSLLAVIKIEAEQHQCAVIGEDLGLVPDGFRDTMRAHGFYGYSVLQYEKEDTGAFRDPASIPAQVLSCFATHDTPTVKGYEIGTDINWWEQLDWVDAPTAQHMRNARLSEVSAFTSGGDFHTMITSWLAQSDACLVAVQLDDILGASEAQNLPGTIEQHPNWRRKYDVYLEYLPDDAKFNATAKIMQDAARGRISER